MEPVYVLVGVVAGGALVVVFLRLGRDLLRQREQIRLIEDELAQRNRDVAGMHGKNGVAEWVTIEVTTPAGLVLLPLRPDDPESIGRFLREAEKARGEPTYATG